MRSEQSTKTPLTYNEVEMNEEQTKTDTQKKETALLEMHAPTCIANKYNCYAHLMLNYFKLFEMLKSMNSEMEMYITIMMICLLSLRFFLLLLFDFCVQFRLITEKSPRQNH